MQCRVSIWHISFATNLWYLSLPTSLLLISTLSWLNWGVTSFTFRHTKRSRKYFHWHTLMSSFDLVPISIPRKYRIYLKSLTSNSVARVFLSLSISIKLFLVRIILSYTIKFVFHPSFDSGRTKCNLTILASTLDFLSLLHIYQNMLWGIV